MTERKETSPIEARKSEILKILKSPDLRAATNDEGLRKGWLDELSTNLGPSIAEAKEQDRAIASVAQYTDTNLSNDPNAYFATVFLQSFGAYVELNGNRIQLDATNLAEVANNPKLPVGEDNYISTTEDITEAKVWLYKTGKPNYMLVKTKIDGVFILMDGSALLSSTDSYRQLRPSLFVKVNDSGVNDKASETVEASSPDHGMRLANVAAVKGDDWENQIAQAGANVQPRAKPETDFQINRPDLKDNPELKTEEERKLAVERAYNIALRHMHQAEQKRAKGVGGMKAYGLSIMSETFRNTPDQIVNDEGALSDLVEYLMAMVLNEDKIDMRSTEFNSGKSENPTINLVVQLQNTWDLPDNEFGSPYMYERVNWKKRNLGSSN